MSGRLDGKVALVTGAGSGFGEAIAHAYAAQGAKVLIADIAEENGQRVASAIADKSYPGEAIFVQLNVTKRSDWEQGLEIAKQKFGKLDIVVNNAGTTYKKQPSIEVSEEDFDRIVAVNIKSIYLSVSVLMPYFVERKSGVFLSTSSIAGIRVRPGQVLYGGTNVFVNTVWLLSIFGHTVGPADIALDHPRARRRVWTGRRKSKLDLSIEKCDGLA